MPSSGSRCVNVVTLSAFVHAVEGYGAAPGKHFQQGVRAVRHLAETFDATGRKSEADAVRTAFAAGPAPPSR